MKFLHFLLLFFISSTICYAQMDYASYDEILHKYVKNAGVDYKALAENKSTLDEALQIFEETQPSSDWSQEAQLAYWMNAYNAYTLKLIVDNYPLKSILDLHNGKPWDVEFVNLGEHTYSLNAIEHEILRKMGDPRIHVGINCASVSCPNIYKRAFTPENVNDLLDTLMTNFIMDETKNQINGKVVRLSQIFNWFAEDFGDNKQIIDLINRYSEGVEKLPSKTKIKFLEYNWALNEN